MQLRESLFHWKVRLAVGAALGGAAAILAFAARKAFKAIAVSSPALSS